MAGFPASGCRLLLLLVLAYACTAPKSSAADAQVLVHGVGPVFAVLERAHQCNHYLSIAQVLLPAVGAGPPQAIPHSPGALRACLAAIPGRPDVLLPSTTPLAQFLVLANGLRTLRTHLPAAVVFPVSVQQVQAAVRCATGSNVTPVPRSGGYSFENLCSGDGALVIDLSGMAAVTTHVANRTAVAQGGVRIGNLYMAVAGAGRAAGLNLTFVGGVWPQTGFGGLMAAGGYGSLARKHGLLVDKVLSAQVVVANGSLLQASPASHPDLFWALRGGGGGTYGIVTEATLRLVEVPLVTIGALVTKDLEPLEQMLDRFQRWAPSAPPELTLTFNVFGTHVQLKLVHLGPAEELRSLMASSGLLGVRGAAYSQLECSMLGARAWLVQPSSSPPNCPSKADLAVPQRVAVSGSNVMYADRRADKLASGFFRAPIPAAGLAQLRALLGAGGAQGGRRQRAYGYFGATGSQLFQFKAYGGALAAVADDATPYPHRKGVLMSLEYGCTFGPRAGVPATLQQPQGAAGQRADALPRLQPASANDTHIWAWYQRARAWVQQYGSGERYSGYVSLDDTPEQYFLHNYERLRAVKRAYDPGNVFRNALSVPPAGA